jgi:ketosteroid isomerase-like protein
MIFFTQGALVGSESEDDLKAKVDAIGNKAEECFLSGDIDAMLEYYCDDIISMPNLHPMVKGKSDLKLMTETVLNSGIKFNSLESTTIEAKSCGDFVYEVGVYSQVIIMPNLKEPIEQSGKYVTIWKKQPGEKLRIAVEIYNSDESPQKKKGK